jgi:hypothetical protein
MRVASVALFLFFVIGVAAAPVPKELKKKFPDYYPLAAGSVWEYKFGSNVWTTRVAEYEVKDGVKTAKLKCVFQDKEMAARVVRVDKTGVTQSYVDMKADTKALILKFGLVDEEGWEVLDDQSKVSGKFTLKGTEKVTVPAGTFEAVVLTQTIPDTKTSFRYWYADGVGLVKLVQTDSGFDQIPLELKKYTPGKSAQSK